MMIGYRGLPQRWRTLRPTEPTRLPNQGAIMGEKSRGQAEVKNVGKSIKEKRADKAVKAGLNRDTSAVIVPGKKKG